MEAHAQSCVHDGTNKNIYFKIFSFGRVVFSRQCVSNSEDKVTSEVTWALYDRKLVVTF